MADAHKNLAYSLVATAPSPATSGTSLVVTAGQGSLFPTVPFNATIWITGANPITTNAEIVRVTAISTDTLTIVRAQESTTARTVVVGDQIAATITAKTLTDAETNYALSAYQLIGGAILAEPLAGGLTNITVVVTFGTGELRFTMVYLPKAATITGVKWYQGTQGAYTAASYNGVGVYSLSAGTMTLQASSTNDGNIWKAAANGVASKAFSSTVALQAGVYVIAALFVQSALTTAPTIGGFTAVANGAIHSGDYANSVKTSGFISSQTALPSPTQAMSGVSGATTQYMYFSLY